MSNAISIASTASVPFVQAGSGKAGQSPMGAFLDLLTASLSNAQPLQSPDGLMPPAGSLALTLEGSEDESDLTALFAQLVELLDGLSANLKNGDPFDSQTLMQIEDLVQGLEAGLAHGVSLPALSPETLARLAPLGEAFGLSLAADAGGGTPHDAISALLARLSQALGDEAPELATRLTALTRQMDAASAALQTATAEQQAIALGGLRRLDSETRLNPAAALAAAQNEGQGETELVNAPTEVKAQSGLADAPLRALTRPDSGPTSSAQPPQPNGPVPATAEANLAAASTAPAPAELDAPDGLTLTAPQPGAQPATGAAARPEAVAYQRPEAHINYPHIAAEISRHVQNGVSRFEIKLNPAELGRIDVRMEMDGSGNVIARLAVERSETLDLLQRDQRALMRALTEAGIDAGKTDLEFSLQQDGRNAWSESDRDDDAHKRPINLGTGTQNLALTAEPDRYMRGYARLDAVNLWV